MVLSQVVFYQRLEPGFFNAITPAVDRYSVCGEQCKLYIGPLFQPDSRNTSGKVTRSMMACLSSNARERMTPRGSLSWYVLSRAPAGPPRINTGNYNRNRARFMPYRQPARVCIAGQDKT